MRMFLNDAASPQSFTSLKDDKGPKSVGGGGGREQTTRAPAEIVYQPACPLALCLGGRSSVDCAKGGGGVKFRALSRLISRGGYEDGKDQRQHNPRLLGQVGRREP